MSSVENETLPRMGSFFLLAGLVLMLLFLGSIFSREVNPIFFLAGAACIALGVALARRRAHRPPSTRFNTVRKVQEYGRTRREQREMKKKERNNKDDKKEQGK